MPAGKDAMASRGAETPLERTTQFFRLQAEACRVLGSPLYASLLRHAADDVLAGGPTADVIDGHLQDPGGSALALRMLGGAHALALAGQAPGLAAFYPSAGGTADPGPGGCRAWAALRHVLAEHRDAVRGWLDRPPQTNEVGRGAALLGGLCYLTARAPLPIRLVEIGASAGLNLRADRFHITGEARQHGDPSSLVVLPGAWLGTPPPRADVDVVERTGGDVAPIDPGTPGGRLTLTAYVWPDQQDRLRRLRGGLALAAEVPAELRREPASATLASMRLAEGSWTVLWHSIVRQYLDQQQRSGLTDRVAELGAAASASARFGYICFEPDRQARGGGCLVTVTTWPRGDKRVLGVAPPHGMPVTWERG
jgi:hypothetical protein